MVYDNVNNVDRCGYWLWEPSNRIFGKNWDFVPNEGGGLPIPSFYPIFPKIRSEGSPKRSFGNI